MKRLLAPMVVCALVVPVAGAGPVAAQQNGPQGLWEDYPLGPTATPSPDGRGARSAPPVQTPDDDGMSLPALMALLIGAAGFGALTAYIAGRPAPLLTKRAALPVATREIHEETTVPATAEVPEAETTVPATAEVPETETTVPATADVPEARAVRPDPPAPPPAGPAAPAQPSPPRAQPAVRAAARGHPPAGPPRVTPRGRAALSETTAETWRTCEIKLHNRRIRAHFFAVPYEGGPVLARSPYFTLEPGGNDGAGPSPPEALAALVDELTAAGWRQTGAGSTPWDLKFRRGAAALRPAAPNRPR